MLKRTYTAIYTKFDGYWSFQGGSIENTFLHKPVGTQLKSRIDFVVTHRQVDNVNPFRVRDQADYTHLPMSLFDKTDTTFWSGENYLLPDGTEPN